MKLSPLSACLSFNAGFVDTTGFLALQGLFTAHVTGNFVTLGAALVMGSNGIIAKLIALPEFIGVIVIAHLAGLALSRRQKPVLKVLLFGETLLLLGFFLLAVRLGPFPDSDAPLALLTGFAGVAAMAVQNAAQRAHLSASPPTTIMTGNTTQAVLDAVELLHGGDPAKHAAVQTRLLRTIAVIFCFGGGCAAAAVLYTLAGAWSLALPVLVAAGSLFAPSDT